MAFEDILENLSKNGYTIISVTPDSVDVYKRDVIVQDSSGTQTTKVYMLTGFKDITDSSGKVIGADEVWAEVS